MAQTKREKQVQRVMSTRSLQIAATKQQVLIEAMKNSGAMRWWGSGQQPRFGYCTQPVEYIGETGFVSWVGELGGDVIPETVVFHRRRNSAKARAWNLWQGWRHARGLRAKWGSPDEGKDWTR